MVPGPGHRTLRALPRVRRRSRVRGQLDPAAGHPHHRRRGACHRRRRHSGPGEGPALHRQTHRRAGREDRAHPQRQGPRRARTGEGRAAARAPAGRTGDDRRRRGRRTVPGHGRVGAARGDRRADGKRRPGRPRARGLQRLPVVVADPVLLLPLLRPAPALRLHPRHGGGRRPVPRQPGSRGRPHARRAGLDPGGLPGPGATARRRPHGGDAAHRLHRRGDRQGRHVHRPHGLLRTARRAADPDGHGHHPARVRRQPRREGRRARRVRRRHQDRTAGDAA